MRANATLMNIQQVIFIPLLGTICIALFYLSIRGPPPPVAEDVFLPQQSLVAKFHLDNSTFADLSHEGDAAWEALLPANKGVVLASNLTSGLHFWATVAMFHQLECLVMIRKTMQNLGSSSPEPGDRSFHASTEADSVLDAVGYCFDYLRQSLLCSADSTLNPVAELTVGDGHVLITDGNALWQQCRDTSMIYDWAIRSGQPSRSPLVHLQNQDP
ncbi:hypothetical protein BP00DRAFT_273048 [Aspergillus indologenus CBS 114.80]|uniref:Uncharacterized protein n=1 Tax=Aspergillus indologenus CBS 114.80 TaxID=1450541 RepID=A0A2V5IHY2_9EURO|nr:hypothetical protein BP00DRAFT_273048 [Aspergillus indologenus CBS 114.80]